MNYKHEDGTYGIRCSEESGRFYKHENPSRCRHFDCGHFRRIDFGHVFRQTLRRLSEEMQQSLLRERKHSNRYEPKMIEILISPT